MLEVLSVYEYRIVYIDYAIRVPRKEVNVYCKFLNKPPPSE